MDKEIDLKAQVAVLSDLLRKQNDIRNMLDTRANILIGFDSGLVLFLLTYNNEKILGPTYVIALLTLVLSLFSAVFALKPPSFNRKKGQKESIFYHDSISNDSVDTYQNRVLAVLSDKDKIFESYALEVYNLTKYSNGPKKFYAHLAIRILIYGIVLASISYGLMSLIY